MTSLLAGLLAIGGLGLIVSGLPDQWMKWLVGGSLIVIAPLLAKCLVAIADPGTQLTRRHIKAKKRAKKKNKAKQARQDYIESHREQIGFQYFKSTFLFAGHIAAADGTVSAGEQRLFDDYCLRLQLDRAQINAAEDYFNTGRSPAFDATEAIDTFIAVCGDIPVLCENFLQSQFAFVEASGTVVFAELRIIEMLSRRLHAEKNFASLLEEYRNTARENAEAAAQARVDAQRRERDKKRYEAEKARAEQAERAESRQQRTQYGKTPPQRQLRLAFAILGLAPTKDIAAIKRAYRSQIKRHHPDYLLSQGYPDALLKEATKRSAKINHAYETLKKKYQFK